MAFQLMHMGRSKPNPESMTWHPLRARWRNIMKKLESETTPAPRWIADFGEFRATIGVAPFDGAALRWDGGLEPESFRWARKGASRG